MKIDFNNAAEVAGFIAELHGVTLIIIDPDSETLRGNSVLQNMVDNVIDARGGDVKFIKRRL